jgi:penicillin-binding protein 2
MIPASRRRLVALSAIVTALLVVLGGRLWYLQVMHKAAYTTAASQDQTRTIIVPPVRGQILDDVGTTLVGNRTALVVSVNRVLLSQQSDGGVAELHRLARLLGMSYPLLQRKLRICGPKIGQPCWQGSPYQPIPVQEQASPQVALQIMENQRQYPGVTASVQPVTRYAQPYATGAAQMLGYLQPVTSQEMSRLHLPVTGFSGVDLIGQAGLEAQYDQQLRGTAGKQVVSVNAAGAVTGTVHRTPPRPGDTLVTSINAQVQADTSQALAGAIQRAQSEGNAGATTGAAVVMTTTGRVLAMASYPTYDPAIWTGGISARQFGNLFGTAHGEPILNRATQGEYAPGSTWKVTSTAAAMAHGFSASGPYSCPGSVTIAGHTFNNWTSANMGPMSFHQALVMSCDTVYYQVAYQMYLRDHYRANFTASPHAPAQQMQKMELAWGFGKNTGIDLPEESPGVVPTRQWLYNYWTQYKDYWCKHGNQNGSYVQQIEYDNCRSGYQWDPGQAAIAAIGQGYVAVTPIQLAELAAEVANGGTLYRPQFVKEIDALDGSVVRTFPPIVESQTRIDPQALEVVRSAMGDVVNASDGTGKLARIDGIVVAGKTGTAQVVKEAQGARTKENALPDKYRDHGWFMAFAPVDHPQIAIACIIEHSGHGGSSAAPVVKAVMQKYFEMNPPQGAAPLPKTPAADTAPVDPLAD